MVRGVGGPHEVSGELQADHAHEGRQLGEHGTESGRFSVLGYDESGEIIPEPVDEIVGIKQEQPDD